MFSITRRNQVKSFISSVETFLESAAPWLLPEDIPAVVSLQHMAKALDEEMTPALLSQFGLAYRSLLKKKPTDTGDDGDELDDLIPNS
jgi:hypothetical protein